MQNPDTQNISIFDVQIRFESTNESTSRQVRLESFDKARFESSNLRASNRAESSSDFIAMNTRFRIRKQTYATTLIIVDQLNSYFATFSIDLQRLDITSAVLKLHRDDLSIESRYWQQMLSHRFSQEFQSAAIKKMTELKKREIFLLIEKRSNQIRISLIWVFKYKFDIDDYVEKFKTRLCFRDDLQMIHQNIYATTLTAKTFRALMIIATAFDLDIWQYDAMSAFINNSIDEKIYNECFDDFVKFDYCWKLLKTLYNLKQISILWYRNLINVLENLRLMSMLEINCLYANDWLILFFYVNDIIILFMKSNANRMRIFEKALMQRFEMRILSSLQWFLNIRITRDREKRKIWLCQNSYIIKMTSKFNLKEIKCSKISLIDLSIRFERNESHVIKSNSQLIYAYQQRIESLNFAAMISRLDIAFITVKLTQFLQISHSNHFSAADRIISYLHEIKNLVIEYSDKRSTNILLCVSDVAFANDETIRRSFDDYLFQLYDDSIDWRIVKQATIIIFSTETELLTLTRIVKKAMWWKRFFEIIRFDSMKILHIRCDNRQTLRILKKDVLKLDTKLKHVDIHRHWLRQKMQTDRIHVNWVLTSEMFADEFIKILSRQKHEEFIRQLNLIDISTILINQKKSAVSAV